MSKRALWDFLGLIFFGISLILDFFGFLFISSGNYLSTVMVLIPGLVLMFSAMIIWGDKRLPFSREMPRDEYRRTRRDHVGIVILATGTIFVISGLGVSLYVGLLLMLVIVVIGAALMVIGIYLNTKVRVRHKKTLSPTDRPRIVLNDLESILDYAYPQKAIAKSEDIEPFSKYRHLSVPFANFWVKIGYLTKAFAKYLGLGLVLTFVFSAIQFVINVNIIHGLLYLIIGFLLMIPGFFLFLLWLMFNSYLFRDKAYLFSEGHPYQDKVLWNVQPGSMTCKLGPASHRTLMDLEISHQIPRSWQGRRIGLILTYPLNFYGSDEFLNHFYIPFPSDLEDGGLLRIYRLGLRFDSDFSDVYFRVHFISLFRYRVLMILWFGIGAFLMIWYLFFIFGPLILILAAFFGIPF